MNLKEYHTIYFIGIGGIGMSALARWFNRDGKAVAGYDRTETPLTRELVAEGIDVHYDDNVDRIPAAFKKSNKNVLVVITPAVPANHHELNFYRESGYTIVKRSEVLGRIASDYKTVAVAGTHGKTTTSSMIAHILRSSGRSMVAFLGGVTANYQSNLIVQGEDETARVVVAEADEFDRSFLRLHPDVAVVTSADPDHLDIYGDAETMVDAYQQFAHQVRNGGALIVNDRIKDLFDKADEHVSVFSYGVNRGEFFASDITPTSREFFEFNLSGFGRVVRVTLGIPGFHNVENAVAAAVATHVLGVALEDIAAALATFRGVKRRFEYILKSDSIVYVDDYAHHPAEIEAFLTSLKAMYPDRKVTVIFQPHLYSRTRDLAEGFGKSLSIADELILMDIYPARELPIPGVDSDLILRYVHGPSTMRCGKAELLNKLEGMNLDVLATVGAGDIDTFIDPIKKMLVEKYAA